MQDASVRFDPVRPPPLAMWKVVVGAVLIVILIVLIVWRLRSRSARNPGSLDIQNR